MAFHRGPKIVTDGLVLALDAANQKLKKGALFYKWFTTNGTNPTTKAGFDAFFGATPQAFGIDENREINWLIVGDRPTYITATTSFAWEVTGFLIINEPGDYVFNTRSDDGNELQINGQVLTSFYGGRGVPSTGDVSSTISLVKGAYPFQYRMQQGIGGAGAQVRWQKPGSSIYEVIPASNFAIGLNNGVPESGITWTDLSGNGNNGTLVNGVGYSGDNGGSLVFDGVNDYVDTGKALLSGSGNFTIVSWVYLDNISKTSNDETNSTVIITQAGNSFTLYASTTYGDADMQIRLLVGAQVLVGPDIRGVGWKCASITRNGNTWILYIDGNEYITGTSSNTIDTNQNTWIGRSAAVGRYFSGKISNVQIYNRALTPQEIQQNFNATRSRFGL
jgi:hypothetical protein